VRRATPCKDAAPSGVHEGRWQQTRQTSTSAVLTLLENSANRQNAENRWQVPMEKQIVIPRRGAASPLPPGHAEGAAGWQHVADVFARSVSGFFRFFAIFRDTLCPLRANKYMGTAGTA